MSDSPRIKRLRSDFRAMERLRAESSILDFDFQGDPPNHYRVVFLGRGLAWSQDAGDVVLANRHEVTIDLNAAYPRMIPDLSWQTPIFHPNISASGIVCLGGYSTHWAPSLTLDEMCVMLWDMIRFKNFDVESPYNREAAIWTRSASCEFPLDVRPLRDLVSSSPAETGHPKPPRSNKAGQTPVETKSGHQEPPAEKTSEVLFIEPEIVDAEILDSDEPDILFIDD